MLRPSQHGALPMSVDAVLIAGPTASGKSAAALELALAIGGAIVNADSMQVYGELQVLTARPSAAEMARVPHLLYGHVTVHEPYSVGRYQSDAAATLAEVRAAGRIPIFVGGTGLYFAALTEGLADIPPVPATCPRRRPRPPRYASVRRPSSPSSPAAIPWLAPASAPATPSGRCGPWR